MVSIEFKNVDLKYPVYHHLTRGLKPFILNFPKSLLEFRRDRFQALNDISFCVNKGENLGIIGRNGAGKSTTLGLIAGVLKPSSGSITVNGRISPFLELGAGFHPELTGRENIEMNGVLMGLRLAQVHDKIEQIISFSDLGEFIEQPIRVYSTGMLTRLGFSVVAHLEPEILLVDEVLAVGDAGFLQKSMQRMLEFKNSRVTMVFVSHAMGDVRKICDRVIWIEDHTIKMQGDPDIVCDAYSETMLN